MFVPLPFDSESPNEKFGRNSTVVIESGFHSILKSPFTELLRLRLQFRELEYEELVVMKFWVADFVLDVFLRP